MILPHCIMVFALAIAACFAQANAQSLSPMRAEIKSFSNHFAIRLYPGNSESTSREMMMRLYDEDYRPIEGQLLPQNFTLAAKSQRQVLAIIPFDGQENRKVRICIETVHPTDQTGASRIRTQVCGTYQARRFSLPSR